MDVHDLLQQESLSAQTKEKTPIQINGWLVIIESKLFLLDEEVREPYTETVKLEISNSEIVFPVRASISPLGGGRSFVFHRSRIEGVLNSSDPLSIHVQKLAIEESTGSNHFQEISLDAASIDSAKEKYGKFLLKPISNNSDDWLDMV